MILNSPIPNTHFIWYLSLLIAMVAVILSALAFEHLGGYVPCKLCLQQREPWYFGIAITGLAILSLLIKWPAFVPRGLVLATGLVMIYSAVLGIHHSGVEWGWWAGPDDCGAVEGGLATTTTDLLRQLEQTVTPSCTDASLRILGLSFAGWNAIASIVLGMAAFWMAFAIED